MLTYHTLTAQPLLKRTLAESVTSEDYIAAPRDSATVLVAVVPHPRDLQLAREAGWYRIPLRHLPRQLAAEYLAFYQTAAFGSERWAVRYYAALQGYRLTTRRLLLPDEPDHPRADDYYYRLDLGPLIPLERPVPAARLRRITFINTTFGQLRRATDVRQLWQPHNEDAASAAAGLWAAGLAGKSIR